MIQIVFLLPGFSNSFGYDGWQGKVLRNTYYTVDTKCDVRGNLND